jgi:hypothetical protein
VYPPFGKLRLRQEYQLVARPQDCAYALSGAYGGRFGRSPAATGLLEFSLGAEEPLQIAICLAKHYCPLQPLSTEEFDHSFNLK